MGILRRRRQGDRPAALRLYYASDIHGSEILWRKFLNAAAGYGAQVLVMGGDVTGKVVVPLVERADGVEVELFGGRSLLTDAGEVEQMEHRIRANGMYPHRMTPAELEQVAGLPEDEREDWFAGVMRRTFDEWLALAGDPLLR